MKLRFNIAIIFLLIFTSCSLDSNDSLVSDVQNNTIIEWHLTNVSGGIAGVDINYDVDTIIWIFNVDFNGSGTLSVDNNNDQNDLEDGLNTGEYAVFVAEYDGQPILFLDGDEYAGFSYPNANTLEINHNVHSTGVVGSDGYIFTFQRRVVDN
ncbi:MAG: hypothetical protein ACON5F_04300 [Jejuia sp.]